jgi:hypothetical protein
MTVHCHSSLKYSLVERYRNKHILFLSFNSQNEMSRKMGTAASTIPCPLNLNKPHKHVFRVCSSCGIFLNDGDLKWCKSGTDIVKLVRRMRTGPCNHCVEPGMRQRINSRCSLVSCEVCRNEAIKNLRRYGIE